MVLLGLPRPSAATELSLPVSSGARSDRQARAARPPFDRRLLSEARAARPAVLGAVAVGVAMTVTILVQAVALATVVGRAFTSPSRATPGRLLTPVVVFAAAVAARALLALVGEIVAEKGATAVRREMRGRLLGRLVGRGPAAASSERPGEESGALLLLATRGVDSLHQYFAAYLPQLVVGVIAPVIFLGWMLGVDHWSALILAAALAIVPVFMILLGQEAAERMRRQWSELERLGGHFADVVHGLTTLKLFDRVAHQLKAIAATTDRLRVATLETLRFAFLSSFVFELLASLATALVAIVLGLRLLSGQVHLSMALAVLLVAPEVFLPLRKASARFHAAADGIGASDRLLAVLGDPDGARPQEPPVAAPGAGTAPCRRAGSGGAAGSPSPLVACRSALWSRGRSGFSLGPLDLGMGAGERLAVIGPTGCGKTTLLLALLGYLPPSSGELLLGDDADGTAGLEAWRRRVSWLPQAPAIVTGSVLANVTLTAPEAGRREAAAALGRARADDLVASLGGIDTVLDEGGRRLSSGERQRIALARALCRRAELYLLDEPTAHLDAAIEQEVVAGILEGAGAAALVIVTHSPSVAAACDRVLDLDMLTGLVQGAGEVFRPLAGAIGRA